MPYLPLSGGSLFYAIHRSRETHPLSVVFVHGAGGNHLSWPASLRRLSLSATTYLPDLPGHGRSRSEGRGSIEAYAAVMSKFCRCLGLTSVAIVGHSMGGAVALAIALGYPQLCEKLVLLNSAARFAVPPGIMAALDDDHESAVDAICRYTFTAGPTPSLIEATRKIMLDLPLETLRRDFLTCQSFDVERRLGDVQVPTLVIGAEDDELTPPADQLILADRIPEVQLVLLPGGGHMAPLTHQQETARHIRQFLDLD